MSNRSTRPHSSLEYLEARIAPASVITYFDVDRDKVKITSSGGDLTGKVTFLNLGLGQQVQLIDLSAAEFAGVDLKVTVTKAKGGDGAANIGYINAGSNDLGQVSVAGDLGQIDVGDGNADVPAIEALTVRSFGVLGVATQQPGGSLLSSFDGDIGKLTVNGDVRDATFEVNGAIGSISIGGSFIGGSNDFSANIKAKGTIGPVNIGGDIIGGLGRLSAVIESGESSIGDVTIGGSLIAGPGEIAGMISAPGSIGDVKIGKTFRGGSEGYSGLIRSETDSIGNITIGRSFIGGSAVEAGYIWAQQNIGNIKIGGALQGGSGSFAGTIKALTGSIENVNVGKGVFGGTADETGEIFARLDIKSLKVGGDVRGGEGAFSGNLQAEAGKIGNVTIKGSLVGGGAFRTGMLVGQLGLGVVKISGSVVGGDYEESGSVFAPEGAISSLSISGSLVGGEESATGFIWAGGLVNSLEIDEDIIGGSSKTGLIVDYTGAILAGALEKVTIGGSIIAGLNLESLGQSGSIQATANIGTLTVKGGLTGNATHAVAITAVGEAEPSATRDQAIGKIKIGGDVSYARIIAGVDKGYGYVNGNAQIGNVTIGGDWLASSLSAGVDPGVDGQFGDDTDAIIGMGTIARIASITVKGQIVGTAVAGDHFGFVSHKIGEFQNGSMTYIPSPGDLALELSPATGDTSVRLV